MQSARLGSRTRLRGAWVPAGDARGRTPPGRGAHGTICEGVFQGHRAISFDLGAAVPESHLPDLAHRYGDKVQLKAATKCRSLSEAPPLSKVDRSGTGHGRPESVSRKVHAEKCFPQQLHIQKILPWPPSRTSTVTARPRPGSVAPAAITKTAHSILRPCGHAPHPFDESLHRLRGFALSAQQVGGQHRRGAGQGTNGDVRAL